MEEFQAFSEDWSNRSVTAGRDAALRRPDGAARRPYHSRPAVTDRLRIGNGLFRFKKTGGIYGAFKVDGRTRWKCLETEDMAVGRQRLAEEIKKSSRIDWRQAASVTVSQLVERYELNPMGLTPSTMKIRIILLSVFKRSWQFGLGIRASEVKPFMLKAWLAKRRQEQSLKASGVNNYVRLLHGPFGLALDLESVAENAAAKLKLLKEESPKGRHHHGNKPWPSSTRLIATAAKIRSRLCFS
jgi:hypothetical protein